MDKDIGQGQRLTTSGSFFVVSMDVRTALRQRWKRIILF